MLLCMLPLGTIAQENLKILDQNGNVLLVAREEGILIRKMTTAERLLVPGLDADDNGLMIYDKDTKSIWLWHDTEWVELDGIDLVDDADSDPTNELQNWGNLPGIPIGFLDGIDDVNDADSDSLNEINNSLSRNGTNLELTDAAGTLITNIGWAVDTGKVFNTTDHIGIGTNTTPAKLTVQSGAVLFQGTTGAVPVSGAGTRLMWVPEKHAFRAGIVSSMQWDDGNIGARSFVGGGTDNLASGWNAIVAGGGSGSATADGAFAGGGFNNTASGINSFVGGGDGNTASGNNAQVASGSLNVASGGNSFVGGGLSNTAGGYASFASGRENVVTANHGFAGGHGLLVKSFGEAVFGSFNSDYTPASADGFVGTDRLFTIGNGTNANTRSNAMTILKDGKVGLGTDTPETGLHVKGNKGAGEYVMLLENENHEGSGLQIKIDGSHPLWVTGEGGNPDFFVTHPGSAIVDVFEPLVDDIRTYLMNNNSLSLADINLSEIASPGGLMDQLGLVEFVSGGICKGAETLVDLINGVGLESISLPDLPLDSMPHDLPDVPFMPTIPAIPGFTVVIPDPEVWIPFPVAEYVTIPIPNVNVSSSFINTPINEFNDEIDNTNTGIQTVNTELENGYDLLKDGLVAIDGLEIPLPQLQVPQTIGPITCPNPNPLDTLSFSFESLNPLDYNIVDPLSSENAFITFSDQYNNTLGAITAQGLGEFAQDYFDPEKVLEIGSHVLGLFSDDGNILENLFTLGKEAFDFYRATDNIGVLYSSGHGDYAEWLEREDVNEQIGYGDIIGIRGGKISLSVEDAEQVMVVSKAPIVLGNIPAPGKERYGNNVAFIGQVPVKVMGPVKTGDFIIANPSTPGYGMAIPENEITADQMTLAVGKSWETNLTPGFKFVNTIVGMHNNGWATPVTKLQQRIDAQEAALEALTARLDKLEYTNTSLAAERKKGNR